MRLTLLAYAGAAIAASLVWLPVVEGRTPDRWDLIGTGLCLAGTAIIVFGVRRPVP